jgi:diguanylate cyclase (GGDEF)-like protein
MLVTGGLAGVVAGALRWLDGYLPWSGAGAVVASAVIAALVLGPLLYFFVIEPIKRGFRTPTATPAPVDDKNQFITIDPLTRTLNRRGITASLLEAMAQAQRYSNPLSIALIDIDNLTRINEKYGLAAGNRALELFAYTITESLRLPDRVGRHTDDEFLVVMPQTKAAAAIKVAERIRTAIELMEMDIDHYKVKVSASIGVAEFRKGQDLEEFLGSVLNAMREAQNEGNRVVRAKATKK